MENKKMFILLDRVTDSNYFCHATICRSSYLIDSKPPISLVPSALLKTNIEVFISDLYVYYSLFFLIGGSILLVAMVGAITLIYLIKKKC